MSNKINITEDLISDLKQYGSQVSVGMATVIRDELFNVAIYAISAFYADYTPTYYKRHYSNFLKHSFKKYYTNPHNSIVRGGVELSPDDMSDIYKDKTEEVFDMVYAGFHGASSGFYEPKSFQSTPRMSPSPMEIIEKEQETIIGNIQKYKKYGLDKASKKSYQTLH